MDHPWLHVGTTCSWAWFGKEKNISDGKTYFEKTRVLFAKGTHDKME
jgi:hypothetical protein